MAEAVELTGVTHEGPGGSRLGFARLRFDDDLERAFGEYWFEHSLLFTRLAIVLTVVLQSPSRGHRSRSPLTVPGPSPARSTSSSPVHVTTPPGTPTTGSRQTTDD